MTEQSMTEHGMTEHHRALQSMPELSMTQHGMTEQNRARQSMTEQITTQHGMTEQSMTEHARTTHGPRGPSLSVPPPQPRGLRVPPVVARLCLVVVFRVGGNGRKAFAI